MGHKDRLALLKAKYCLLVVAASGTQNNTKKHVTLKFNRVLEVVEEHVHAKC